MFIQVFVLATEGNEEKYDSVRRAICERIIKAKTNSLPNQLNGEDYICETKMNLNKTWGTDIEIIHFSLV